MSRGISGTQKKHTNLIVIYVFLTLCKCIYKIRPINVLIHLSQIVYMYKRLIVGNILKGKLHYMFFPILGIMSVWVRMND